MAHAKTAAKDDRVRVFLRQCRFFFLIEAHANKYPAEIMIKRLLPNPIPPSEPYALKGYLNKYTNVAIGYNTP